MPRTILHDHLALAMVVFVAIFLLQLPLVLNPGYFSHDELQWAAFASAGQTFSWTAFDAFQYRPLTFNLWLWLSKRLFDHPQGFHAVMVGLGALNGALLALLAKRLAVAPAAALVGALVFALGPYGMYVHGWVGTLGDLLWVGFALLAGLATTCFRNWLAVIASVVVLTSLALLSKEAAVSIPPLLGVGWWFLGRPRIWAVAAVAAAVPVLLYLGMHL
ncbi:MAG: hypothetical protein LC715_02205, partial [Gammaproteobacteria bacterium]|nr:hypothetical protein [Gammaproteobacteria bacterium]